MEQIILFAFLIIFPFGQIVKIGIINPLDIVVGVGAVYAIVKKLPKPHYFKYFENFLLVALFSWIVGIFIFGKTEVLIGLMYFLRLTAYFYFFIFVWNFKDKKILLNSLLVVSVFSAIFGWIQYLWFPDLTSLKVLGWDDHLNRMVGTFLDPTFLGLVLVLGLALALEKKKRGIIIFLLASIAFTYSRASFLAALVPLIYKKAWVYLALFGALILFLPRTAGEGVKLERTSSIYGRIESYQETIEIIKKNPIFGVGFNNICLAKNGDFKNHSCSGSESSLLFLLATTGVVGLISLLHLLTQIPRYPLLVVSFTSVVVHSFFANSLFYPWILGWLLILTAASSVKARQR
jgi:hypothetical protein